VAEPITSVQAAISRMRAADRQLFSELEDEMARLDVQIAEARRRLEQLA
jgi:uncharacterized protein YceH (UPF0502 family)